MTTRAATGKPRFQHSYSKLSLYGSCPGAFKKRHVDKEPERPSVLRDRGRLVHEIARDYVRELVSRMKEQDVALMREVAQSRYKQQDYLPGEHYTEVLEIAETLAGNFELDWMHVAGVEKFFTMKLGPYVFRGLKDLVIRDGELSRVIDWKTPYRITPQSEVDRSLQLRAYGLAEIRECPEIQQVRVELFHCRQGVPVAVEYWREELEAVEEQLLVLIEKLEAERDFPFTPGSFCSLCDYTATCPAMKNARESGEVIIATAEDAARAAGERTLLDRRRADLDNALKAWATPHGGIRSGDQVYGFHDVIYRTRDPKKTAELLAKAGIDPFEAGLKFDNKALDQVILKKGSTELVQAIEAVTDKRAFSKFEARKFQGEEGA